MKIGQGTNAVVTGGASGIGLATGRLLASSGAKVVLSDVNAERLDTVVEAGRAEGLDLTGITADVSSTASMNDLARKVFDLVGTVHVLHLNAGIGGLASLLDDSGDDWERVIDINLLGVVWGIKAFLPEMVASGEDAVVAATSSGAGAEGTAYQQAAYAASKAGVLTVMESLHGQLRDAESKVRAAVLLPPLTATHLAGDPTIMDHVENFLRAKGVPATVVTPQQVAEMFVDGVERGRFFIRAGKAESAKFFDGRITEEFLEWNSAVIRGRADAELADDTPDRYLW